MRKIGFIFVLLLAAIAASSSVAGVNPTNVKVQVTFPPSKGNVTVHVVVTNLTGQTLHRLAINTHTQVADPLPTLQQPSGLKWSRLILHDCIHYNPCRNVKDKVANHNSYLILSQDLAPHGSVTLIYQYPPTIHGHYVYVYAWTWVAHSAPGSSALVTAP